MKLQFFTVQTTVSDCDFKMSLLLEDNHEDILGKAMRGLGVSKNELAKRLGVEKLEIEAILNGEVDEKQINAMAIAS